MIEVRIRITSCRNGYLLEKCMRAPWLLEMFFILISVLTTFPRIYTIFQQAVRLRLLYFAICVVITQQIKNENN